ncbi:MAG TPA: amidophosphoribosyltransferase [Gammaproteobacteria bacterium]|nr:amidophosphoribosyltransferase [Gammaproteobacteria bacterium]
MVDRGDFPGESLLLPWCCTLCGQAGLPGLDLCAACHAELPWSRSACPGCAAPLPEGAGAWRCGACLNRPPVWDGAFSALHYAPPIDRLIQELKFHGRLSRGRLLGDLLTQALTAARHTPWPETLIPVPLHRARLKERGFNQSRELALRLSHRLGITLGDSWVERIQPTQPQIGLSAAARRRNLRDAFAVRGKPPAHVAILDDVLTTGSTVAALSTALRAADVTRIEVWTVARSAPDHPAGPAK